MGKRGPKPKPAKILAMRGSRSAASRAVAESEVSPPQKRVPRPPAWLKGRIPLAEWRYIVPKLSAVLTDLDREVVAHWCDAKAMYIEARGQIKEHGLVVLGAKDQLVRNPAVIIQKQAQDTMRDCMKRLGLSPSDRTALGIGLAESPDARGGGKWDAL